MKSYLIYENSIMKADKTNNKCRFKTISLLCLLFTSVFSYSQNDFRSVNWGMTIDQVKENESAPISNEEKSIAGYRNNKAYYNGLDLTYDNVTISERQARMYYHFTNGQLSEIRVIFIPTISYAFDEKMSNTIKWFTPVFDNLKRKNFKYRYPLQCGNDLYVGPNRNDPKNQKIMDQRIWEINDQVLQLIDQMLEEKRYKYCFTVLENERTYCNLIFHSEYDEYQLLSPVVLILTPSYSVKKILKGSDF